MIIIKEVFVQCTLPSYAYFSKSASIKSMNTFVKHFEGIKTEKSDLSRWLKAVLTFDLWHHLYCLNGETELEVTIINQLCF